MRGDGAAGGRAGRKMENCLHFYGKWGMLCIAIGFKNRLRPGLIHSRSGMESLCKNFYKKERKT